jgi:hypothetical protein
VFKSLTILKKEWNKTGAVAIWISSIVAGFLMTPPLGPSQVATPRQLIAFAVTITTICVGLFGVLTLRWSARASATRWFKFCVLVLLLSVTTSAMYYYLSAIWTARWASQIWVIGTDLNQPHMADFLKENPSLLTAHEWLMAHAGKTEEIWTENSLVRNWMILGMVYVLLVPLWGGAFLSMLQAIYCSRAKRGQTIRKKALKVREGPAAVPEI